MSERLPGWGARALGFVRESRANEASAFPSVRGQPMTLYGSCYALLAGYYLGDSRLLSEPVARFIAECQDSETGLMVGPELREFKAAPRVLHDREHLLWHLTCTAVPVCRHFGISLRHPLRAAHPFCDLDFLRRWLDQRNLKQAWFEGNNLLFAGQLLVDLRDMEQHPGAQRALDFWFEWLDSHVDRNTSLWGTDGFCSAMEAVYGGYHQLLVYYHENHPLANPGGLVDTVLRLQHTDGGFNPQGNGGACEDVDCVDILVNFYKRIDYRRAEIRCALRWCLQHILALQNRDGGFPYNRDGAQSHMGIPGTQAAPNQSTLFATWFRIHTLALMAEVLTDEPELQFSFRFTNNLSMGWHQAWVKTDRQLTSADREAEATFERQWERRRKLQFIPRGLGSVRRRASRARVAAGRLLKGSRFRLNNPFKK